MTYLNHGHPITTNPYKSAKNEDKDLKISGYNHMGNLTSIRKPTLAWFSLTSLSHTYHDHGHQILTNTLKSV